MHGEPPQPGMLACGELGLSLRLLVAPTAPLMKLQRDEQRLILEFLIENASRRCCRIANSQHLYPQVQTAQLALYRPVDVLVQ